MKITTFDPMIVTPKAEDAISLFKALGFVKTHQPTTSLETGDITSTRMKDANGFHLDVADVPELPQDMMLIRMNVDNFDEAYEILKSTASRIPEETVRSRKKLPRLQRWFRRPGSVSA